MSCVEYKTWLAAKSACSNRLASVRGFGYVATGAVNINTSAVDATDPCYIASLTPCAPTQASLTPTPAPAPATHAAAGGFSHWGLLALLAAGAGAVYLWKKGP